VRATANEPGNEEKTFDTELSIAHASLTKTTLTNQLSAFRIFHVHLRLNDFLQAIRETAPSIPNPK
jgi:hypothetical protein